MHTYTLIDAMGRRKPPALYRRIIHLNYSIFVCEDFELYWQRKIDDSEREKNQFLNVKSNDGRRCFILVEPIDFCNDNKTYFFAIEFSSFEFLFEYKNRMHLIEN